MNALYDKFDRNPMPQISVGMRGQKVCEMGIRPLYTLARHKPWSWKR